MVNSLAEKGNKILYRDDLEMLKDDTRVILDYFENEINKKIPGVDAKRVYKIFQKDKKLISLIDYFLCSTRKGQSISLINFCDQYINYVWSLYKDKPEEFFRLEDYLEKYLTERLKHFGFKVVNQLRVKTPKGIFVVDIYLPELGYVIELKASTYKRNSFCDSLQREKYEDAFNTACLLLYASQIHEFEKMFFVEKSSIRELLDKF